MRLSTSQLYATNVSTLNRLQSSQLNVQQQLSTGKRVLTASDDPVAAARALETTQSINRLALEKSNQGSATDALKYVDSQLGALTDILQYVRERTVEAGNGTLPQESKNYLATDMRQQFDALLSLANSRDATGEYVFSGYKGDTQPFSGGLAGVSYQGDQGVRTLQVSNSRIMPTSVTGSELFMQLASSNGRFTTSANAANAIISDGSISGPVAYDNERYGIKFTSASAYEVFDLAADPAMSGTPLASGSYVSGQDISLPDPNDPSTQQISLKISGTPAAGDSFSLAPGNASDVFSTLQNLITGLESVTDSEGYNTLISNTLDRLDAALENTSRLRAQFGSQMVEVDALQALGEDLSIHYTDRLDRLVGVDYAAAISDFQLQQSYLEAARSTFAKVTGLSLFNFLS